MKTCILRVILKTEAIKTQKTKKEAKILKEDDHLLSK
jgi:hypothetical protein